MATFDLNAGSNLDWLTGSNWAIGGVTQSAPPTVNDNSNILGAAAGAIRCLITGAGAVCNLLTATAGGTTTTPLSISASGVLTAGNDSALATAMALAGSASTTTPVVINSGLIQLRGNVTQAQAPVQMNAGGMVRFLNCTHAQAMTWQVGVANAQTNAAIKSSGTTVSTRVFFESAVGASGSFTTFGFGTGRWQVQYGTFSNLGTATVDALVFNADNTGTAQVILDDCVFKNCGRVASTQNVHVGATMAVRRNVFKGCLNAVAINIFGGAVTGVTGVHEFFDNSLDAQYRINCGMKIERNISNCPAQQTPIQLLAANGALTWDSNLFCVLLGGTGQSLSFGTNLAGGTVGKTIWTYAGSNGNPHPVSLANGMSTNVTLSMTDWFFDFGDAGWSSDVVGDFIDIFVSATVSVVTTWKFQNIISNGNSAGFGGGHLFRIGGSAQGNGGLNLQFMHNSHYSDGGPSTYNSEAPMINVGETTATIPDGTITLHKSNLIVCPSGRAGSLMSRYGTSNTTVQICASANSTNNAAWNSAVGVGTDGYGYRQAVGANMLFPSGAPGTVLNADPQMVDILRSVAKWDLSLGGPGTQVHAMAELTKRHDPEQTWNVLYNFDDLLSYLKGGWAPANASYAAAHDAGSPLTTAGIWIGAVQGITPPDTSFRIPMVGRRLIAGTGTTMSYLGIPLRPGKFFPADVDAGKGRPMLAGAEIQCVLVKIEEPGNLNADGSFKSIYGQFLMSSSAQNVDVVGEFRCDDTRLLGALTEAPTTGTGAPLDSPSNLGPGSERYDVYYITPGVYVPSAPKDLCDSGMFGHSRPESEDPSTGNINTYLTRFRSDMTTYFLGTASGTGWDGVATDRAWYYDPFWMYMCYWARTGNIAYLQHAWARYARARWAYYNGPNGAGTTLFHVDEPHFPQKGAALAWWLAKDTLARTMAHYFGSRGLNTGFSEHNDLGNATDNEGRQRKASNAIRGIIWQMLHGFTTDQFGVTLTSAYRLQSILKFICDPAGPALMPVPTWDTITLELNGVVIPRISRQQLFINGVSIMCHLPFQGALEADALIEWYDRMPAAAGGADPRLLTAIKALADFWWANCQSPPPTSGPGSARGIVMQFSTATYNGPTGNSGGTGPSVDLNGFFLKAYYWLGWRLADQTYIDRGDVLLDAHTRTPHDGVTGPFINNPGSNGSCKQQIEWGFNSIDALGTRALAVTAVANAGSGTNSTILVTPAGGMSFTTRIGAGNPVEQTKTITNGIGSSNLSVLSLSTALLNGAGWLTPTLDATAAPTVMHVQPILGVLTAGVYSAEITVDSTDPTVINNDPITTVTFNVLPAIIAGSWVPWFNRTHRR